MIRKYFLLLFFAGVVSAAADPVELPIGFTPEEWENRDMIYTMGERQTDPPATPIRQIAEFERMQGALIRYPFGISLDLIAEMSEDLIIYCLVSSALQNTAYNSMNAGGVNMNNVEFILGATDSYWTRDYGPWWVVDGNNDIVVVDHTYNRPRPNDNQAPLKMSQHLNTGYYDSDLVTAGGNYMTDGYGIGASTTLVIAENPSLGQTGVDSIMEEYYGINPYFTLDDPNNTYIDHIDTWAKFLSPSKILIRSVPESHPQYDEIEAAADFFETNMNAFGEPYEIFRVYTPQNQPYTNSIILNEKVLVPVMNSPWDEDALAVYQEAMPGYEVLGFTGTWESTDALHCRVKGIPDLGMLELFHNPIDNQTVPADSYEVQVKIIPLSGEPLIQGELYVSWKNSFMTDYESTPLIATDEPDQFVGFIPMQPEDTQVRYFIHAADESGRVETLPLAGYYQFDAMGGTPAIPGDVNQDGQLNVLDIVTIVAHILGTQPLDGYPLMLADANGDGSVNVLDVITIINSITGNG